MRGWLSRKDGWVSSTKRGYEPTQVLGGQGRWPTVADDTTNSVEVSYECIAELHTEKRPVEEDFID